QHLARLGRKSLSFSKSVELHDKVIGHYLTIKHYQGSFAGEGEILR
ncbi:TPA: hypothetical protein J2F86_004637, partial [Escherichia coli]|nr:hypothetical protein [Escherichia coli]